MSDPHDPYSPPRARRQPDHAFGLRIPSVPRAGSESFAAPEPLLAAEPLPAPDVRARRALVAVRRT